MFLMVNVINSLYFPFTNIKSLCDFIYNAAAPLYFGEFVKNLIHSVFGFCMKIWVISQSK